MDFFSKIFKHKKILFFACLFLFIFAFSFVTDVKIAHAGNCTATNFSSCVCNGQVCELHNDVTGILDTNHLCSTDADCGGRNNIDIGALCGSKTWFSSWLSPVSDAAKATIAGIADAIEWIPKTISLLVAKVTGWVMDTVLKWPTTNPGSASAGSVGQGGALAFMNGWAADRDLANMLIVLGFIVVAISFALRLGEYGSKKVLMNLIIIAILVNFSGLFCGLIIDASNLTMNGLLRGSSSSSTNNPQDNMAMNFYSRINAAEKRITCPMIPDNLSGYIGSDIMFGWLYLALVSCFVFLTFMLVVRYAALGILFVLSPLAVFCWVFPATKSIWNKWLNSFLKWAFIGVYLCFFLNLVANMLEKMPILSPTNTSTDLTTLVSYFLICILTLFAGYYISLKAAAATAPAVVAAVKTSIGFATGAVVGFAAGGYAGMAKGAMSGAEKGGMGGGAMGGISGGAQGATAGGGLGGAVYNRTQGIRGQMGRFAERYLGRKTGTTATNEAAAVSAEQKGMDAALASGNATDKARVQQLAKTGTGAKRIAALAAVTSAGQLHETFKDARGNFDVEAAGTALSSAKQYGRGDIIRTAMEKNYQLAGSEDLNKDAIDIYETNHLGGAPATPASRASAVRAVKMLQLKKNMPSMSTRDYGNIESTVFDDYDFVKENLTPHAVEQIYITADAVKKAKLQAHMRQLWLDSTSASSTAETTRLQKLHDAINK